MAWGGHLSCTTPFRLFLRRESKVESYKPERWNTNAGMNERREREREKEKKKNVFKNLSAFFV
jgi:hypothetical protein